MPRENHRGLQGSVYPVLVWAMVPSLIKLHRLQEAYVLLTKMLETLSLSKESVFTYQPAHAELYAQRGVVLSMLGCKYRGMLDLHRAIALDPANHRLYKTRGLLHMEITSWDAAFHDLWRALCHDSGDEQCADALMHVLEQLQASAPHPG